MEPADFCLDCAAGRVYGWVSPRGLRRLYLCPSDAPELEVAPADSLDGVTKEVCEGLRRYFDGAPEAFAQIPLDLEASTPFQRQVWEAARNIPWGETRTYGQLARTVGRPKGARAVGQALGANPVPIVVPCHRILAADHRLGGFTGGLDWKRALLRIEGSSFD